MANEAGGLPAVKGPVVPDVFADEALSFELVNGTIRIGFSSVQMIDAAAPSDVQHVLIGRLIMPVDSATRMAIMLNSYLESHGVNLKDAIPDASGPLN